MIDTVVLQTPLDSNLYRHIRGYMSEKRSVSTQTGEVDYLLYALRSTAGMSEVNCSIKLNQWQVLPGSRQPKKVMLDEPILTIEGSVHKAMLGHNVFSGPRKIQPALRWYLHEVGELFETDMPELKHWLIYRLDVAEIYDLGSEGNVISWINARKLALYPRRNVQFFANRGLSASGTTTVLRAYAKGQQHFSSGGYAATKRLCHSTYKEIAAEACRYLRCELQINRDKLFSLHSNAPFATIVTEDTVYSLYDSEWAKFMQEAAYDTPAVRASSDVFAVLKQTYPELAVTLFGAWTIMATQGEGFYKENTSPATFRRHRSLLRDCNVSWFGTDLVIANCPIADFVPKVDSPLRMLATHPIVEAYLQQYA